MSPYLVEDVMTIPRHYLAGSMFFGWVMLTAHVSAAQLPPIPGVTGTIALPANVEQFYSDLNRILVYTIDGIDHAVGGSETKARGESASLDSLRPGTPVVVQYTVKGIPASAYELDPTEPGGVKPNQGIVTSIDKKHVTIRFSDGATQTLRYTTHATKWSENHVRHGDRVVVYTSDEFGHRNTHYFKPVR
jgi:hypothetical protein